MSEWIKMKRKGDKCEKQKNSQSDHMARVWQCVFGTSRTMRSGEFHLKGESIVTLYTNEDLHFASSNMQ